MQCAVISKVLSLNLAMFAKVIRVILGEEQNTAEINIDMWSLVVTCEERGRERQL